MTYRCPQRGAWIIVFTNLGSQIDKSSGLGKKRGGGGGVGGERIGSVFESDWTGLIRRNLRSDVVYQRSYYNGCNDRD